MSERLQVGGSHYAAQGGYEHWDWVLDAGLGYLDGYATKYVTRWWKKDGLKDLQKAKSCVLKMIAEFDKVFSLAMETPHDIDDINDRFIKANSLPAREADFCIAMSLWVDVEDLSDACDMLDDLIRAAEGVAPIAAPTMAGGAASPAPALPCGPVACAVGQGAASNSPTDVHGSGHPAPFGYDEQAETGFNSIQTTKTEDGYNG